MNFLEKKICKSVTSVVCKCIQLEQLLFFLLCVKFYLFLHNLCFCAVCKKNHLKVVVEQENERNIIYLLKIYFYSVE